MLYGACDSVVRRPYRPFVEALEQLVRSTDGRRCAPTLGAEGGELSRLLPDLAQRVGELPLPLAADPDTERHRLHSAVADLLAGGRPASAAGVVIEDGHWADTPTLLLLRHLARGAADARALVVTTFRDTEAEVPEALSAALVDLRRSEGVVAAATRRPQRRGDVRVRRARRRWRPRRGSAARSAACCSELTGGNAFLMTELWRTLLEADAVSVDAADRGWHGRSAELGSPEGVREVVSQRLARLEPPATRAARAGRRRRARVRAAS